MNKHIFMVTWLTLACLFTPWAAARPQPLPVHVQILLAKVKTAMDEGDYALAIDLIQKDEKSGFQKKTSAAPCSHPLVCLALGNCHLLRQAYNPAEAAYLKALVLDPDCLDARVNLAKAYADDNRHDKAAPAFLAAYDLSDPKTPSYLYYAAVMTLMDNRAKEAVPLFERLLSTHPAETTIQWKENYANALMTANLWKRAIPVVRELARCTREENRVKWQETLLQVYLTLEDWAAAESFATFLARQSPQEARWWKALVHVHLSRSQYDKALDKLVILSFVTPLSREEKKLMADLSLQLDVPARAAAAYEDLLGRATPPDPRKDRALIQRLVQALRQMGRSEAALSLLSRLDPKTLGPELLMLKGDLLYEAKDFRAANIAYCMAAKKDCPRMGQAWLMAGYAAWQHNDIKGSRSAFEKAARFKGFRKDALAAIEQLDRRIQM